MKRAPQGNKSEKKTDPAQRKLDELHELRIAGPTTDSANILRPYISDRSNSVVAKAAALAAQFSCKILEAELTTAFTRFMRDGDPQCLAKTAIAKALRDLETDDPAVFFQGARHIQLEPVWGGSADSAGELRANCAHALVSNPIAQIHDIYLLLVDLLADTLPRVRAEAALALGRLEHSQSELLLRLKIRFGDPEPSVIGACFDGMLGAAPKTAVAYLAPFLNHDEDIAFQAASALGASRLDDAFELLLAKIRSQHRQSDTILRCLAPRRFHAGSRALIEAAVQTNGGEALQKTFLREFPNTPE